MNLWGTDQECTGCGGPGPTKNEKLPAPLPTIPGLFALLLPLVRKMLEGH
jgi:hypothetical protein